LRRTREQVAQSIPVRNKLVEWRKEESGEVSLIIPVDQKRHLRILIRVMGLPNKRVIGLDEVGSYVWERCDGETTFGDLIQELTQQFQMTPREAEASLTEYFRLLGRRGILGFVVSEAAAQQADDTSRSKARTKRRGR
jgi:hypothetical protein